MTLPILLNYLQSPAHKSFVNFEGHPNGDAMDLGWRNKYNNPNQPLYSLGEMQVLGAQYFKDAGNNIALGAQYDNEQDVWAAIGHMQNAAIVKVGDILTRESQIGNMGDTGKSFGPHAHVRMCFVSKGTPFSWDALFNAPRVNPYDYIYATPEMDVLDMKAMPNDWSVLENIVPEKPSISEVYKISAGSTLYDGNGHPYSIKTTKPQTVTIIRKNNGMGLFKASWLIGVSEAWVKLESTAEQSKPVSDIGKSWTPKSFPLKLYPQSTGGTNYGPSKTKRTYKILDESNGRVQIQHKLFDAPQNKVWVNKSDGRVG